MHNVKIWFRNILAHKTTFVITFGGFAASMCVLFTLSSYVAEELSVDQAFANLDRIHRVIRSDNSTLVEDDGREIILSSIPEIEDANRYAFAPDQAVLSDDIVFSGDLILADESFFNIFSLKFISGDPSGIFADINNVVLTESFARKVFQGKDPIGKMITVAHSHQLIVAGIVEDLPKRSSLSADLFCHLEQRIVYSQMDNIYFSRLFVLLKSGSDIASVEQKISQILFENEKLEGKHPEYKLSPFKEAYFNQTIQWDDLQHANVEMIILLLSVAIIILILSALNYINLVTAVNLSRAKEFGIKKTSGAGRKEIFVQILSETLYGVVFTLISGLVLAEILSPVFNPVLGREVDLGILLSQPLFGLILLGIVVSITILTGVYPAYLASISQPISLLGGGIIHTKGTWLRNGLSLFQFAVSIVLIIILFSVIEQIEYVKNKDLGFNKDKLLNINVHWRLGEKSLVIKDKLLSYPAIKNVSVTHGSPGAIRWGLGRDFSALHVDEDFFETFQIPFLEGRSFYPSEKSYGVCILNEAAVKKIEMENQLGKKIDFGQVAGIVGDFHFRDLHESIGPLVIFPNFIESYSNIAVRIDASDINGAMKYIKEAWDEVAPYYEFDYTFYDDWFDNMYKQEERTASAIKLFAVIAVVISCLGIFGLAELSAKTRIKEIGIRKTFGASSSNIIVLFNRNVLYVVLAAFILAVPVAYFLVSNWLERFAYKIDLGWHEFVLSGCIALVIAFVTVSYHSIKAATANPVESLRYE